MIERPTAGRPGCRAMGLWRRVLVASLLPAFAAAAGDAPPGPPYLLQSVVPNPGTTGEPLTAVLARNRAYGCGSIVSESQVRSGSTVRITQFVIASPCPPMPQDSISIPIQGAFSPGAYTLVYETPLGGGLQSVPFLVAATRVPLSDPFWLAALMLVVGATGELVYRRRSLLVK